MAGKAMLPKTRRQSPRKSASKSQREKIAATIAKLDRIKAPTPKPARAIALLRSWLADESGYDEETLPKLKKALDRERGRVGARRLFDV